MNMISTTGFRPQTAAPTAAPMKAISEIGVSMTRAGPCLASSPSVTLNGPPASATSSPIRMTVGSSVIASSSALKHRLPCPYLGHLTSLNRSDLAIVPPGRRPI